MEKSNRSFQVEYHDTSLRDGTHDVTFTLSEDAEDALFAAFDREISGAVRDGIIPDQKVHLLRRLCEQQAEHPPWIEASDDKRTYDLELSSWDYHLLTKIVGESLSNVIRPEGADRYGELVEVWSEITEQMQIDKEIDEIIDEAARDLYDDKFEHFDCIVGDGDFYRFSDGERVWYEGADCDHKFEDIGGSNDGCPKC